MPVVAQGSVLTPPFQLDAKNSTGDYVDPTNISLDFKDALGDSVLGFPVTYPADIVKDAIGRYHYQYTIPVDLPRGNYIAQWDAILLGAPETAMETYVIVPSGSLSVGPLLFLSKPDDYESVRSLLAVTQLDVADSDIEYPAFGPQAELEVKRRISNWSTQIADTDSYFILRLATIYKTACLMAESFMRGGTIGHTRPLGVGEGRDWVQTAEMFCGRYEYWIQIADESDDPGENGSEFLIHPLKVGGPTSARLAHRHGRGTWPNGMPRPGWLSFPPFWE